MKYVRVQQKGKRKVVAKIIDSYSGKIVGKGTSCCHKDDKFVFEIGMKIAEERAWKDYENRMASKRVVYLAVSYDKDCINDDDYTLIYSTSLGGANYNRCISAQGFASGSSSSRKYIRFRLSEEEKTIVMNQRTLSGAIVHGDFANQNEIQSVYLYPEKNGTATEAFVCYTLNYSATGTMNADVALTELLNNTVQIAITINLSQGSTNFGEATEYYLFLNIEE